MALLLRFTILATTLATGPKCDPNHSDDFAVRSARTDALGIVYDVALRGEPRDVRVVELGAGERIVVVATGERLVAAMHGTGDDVHVYDVDALADGEIRRCDPECGELDGVTADVVDLAFDGALPDPTEVDVQWRASSQTDDGSDAAAKGIIDSMGR